MYRMSSSRDYSTKNYVIKRNVRSQWPHVIRCKSVADLLLRLRVRTPSLPWIFVSSKCCVLYMYMSLRRVDPLSRGVLPSMYMSLSVSRRYTNPVHLQWAGRRGRTKKIKASSIRGYIPLNDSVNNECWTGKDLKWSTQPLISGTILSFVSRYRRKPQNFSQC
jgi:hypothetical protein